MLLVRIVLPVTAEDPPCCTSSYRNLVKRCISPMLQAWKGREHAGASSQQQAARVMHRVNGHASHALVLSAVLV